MARLEISERQLDDVTVLDLSGDITFGEGSVQLREALRRLLGEGKKKFFLNFANVGYLDSSGVGELVSGFTAVSRVDGKLKLLNLSPRIYQLLEITKLLPVFDVAEHGAQTSDAFPGGIGEYDRK
jgi:anti-sigma B factor antagonist